VELGEVGAVVVEEAETEEMVAATVAVAAAVAAVAVTVAVVVAAVAVWAGATVPGVEEVRILVVVAGMAPFLLLQRRTT